LRDVGEKRNGRGEGRISKQ